MHERIAPRRRMTAVMLVATMMVAGNALAQGQQQGQAQTQEQGAGQGTLEQRVSRLERIVNNQGLVNMLGQIQQLQSEVGKLKGQLDVQNHTIDQLKQRQRDLYTDIDRRLSQLERNASVTGNSGSAGGMSSTGSMGGTASTTPATASGTASKTPAAGTSSKASASSKVSAPSGSSGSGAAKLGDITKEQHAYQVAFDQLRELHYDQAIAAFQKFVAKYPDGNYAHIAQYWIAEANYAQRHFKAAIAAYQKLLDNYPNSPKRAEAMLKIGYCYYELGEMDRAESILTNLISTYPKTTESGQAQNLLQKVKAQSGQGK